jgi:hypothetical protein
VVVEGIGGTVEPCPGDLQHALAGALQVGVADRVDLERLGVEVVLLGFELDHELPVRPVRVDLVAGHPDVGQRPPDVTLVEELIERAFDPRGMSGTAARRWPSGVRSGLPTA